MGQASRADLKRAERFALRAGQHLVDAAIRLDSAEGEAVAIAARKADHARLLRKARHVLRVIRRLREDEEFLDSIRRKVKKTGLTRARMQELLDEVKRDAWKKRYREAVR